MEDNDLSREWVAALRSGKYKQGKNALRKRDKFCCLGVLCDLVDPEGWDTRQTHFKYGTWVGMYLPPIDICDRVGMDIMGARDLSSLNDTDNQFDVIADEIDYLCGRV